MSYAATFPGFTTEHRGSLIVSVLIHGGILLMLSSSLLIMPAPPVPQLAIEAVVIDETAIQKTQDLERRKVEAEAQQRREDEQRRAEEQQQRREKQAEQQRQAETERQRVEAEKQRQEQLRIKQAEQQKRDAANAEKARVAEEKRAAEQRAADEQRKREAAERAEAERKRMIAAAEAEDRERREADLRAAMQEEEALLAASQSGEMSRYMALIQQKVERNWNRPPTAQAGLECEVAVMQLPNGDVVDVRTVQCNGDDAVRREIEKAVLRSSPLPLPENRLLFDRNLVFLFKPE